MGVWGNVPSYFGGIALVSTIYVIIRDRSERTRHQADRLAAWVERATTPDGKNKVLIKNASDLPCSNVVCRITEGYIDPKKIRLSKTFGTDTDGRRKPMYIHAIGPGQTHITHETTEAVAVRQIAFTDAAGRRWIRDGARLIRGEPTLRCRIRLASWKLRKLAAERMPAIRTSSLDSNRDSNQPG